MSFLVIRQIINNSLLFLDLILAIAIMAHLACDIRHRGWREAYGRLGNQAALAILILTVGHLIIRLWALVLYDYMAEGGNALAVESQYPVALLGAWVALVGMTCCIRIFSPAGWAPWSWLLSLAGTAGFVAITLAF